MSANIVRVNLGEQAYNIVIYHNIINEISSYLLNTLPSRKVCVVTDFAIAKIYLLPFMKVLEEAGFQTCPPIILPAGESSKNIEQLQYIIDKSLSYKLDRKSTLIALGGGVIGDITGFAAAILMRGIGFVQVPTTLLAQVDSSVGGKTGINMSAGKNMVGAFYHPKIVLIDPNVLKTLPLRDLKAGYAEILKYALINDTAFFDWLENNGKGVLAGDAKLQQYAIQVSCAAKASIVEADPEEKKDIRALLNLGHSFGHALEALGGYDGRLLHGEAVSIGCLLAYELSCRIGLCPSTDVEKLRAHLLDTGLMITPPFRVNAQEMLAAMKSDKKNSAGQMTLILSKGIGKAFVAHNVSETAVLSFLQEKFG